MLVDLESRLARARARVTSNVLWFFVNVRNSDSGFLQRSPHSPLHFASSAACQRKRRRWYEVSASMNSLHIGQTHSWRLAGLMHGQMHAAMLSG